MSDKLLSNVIDGAKLKWRALSKRGKAITCVVAVLVVLLLLRACG